MSIRKPQTYSIESGKTKLRAISSENGIEIEGETPIVIRDNGSLRSFRATLSDGRELPVYVEEGDSEHEFNVYLHGDVIPVRVVTPHDERLLALRKNTATAHSTGQIVSAPMPGMLKQMIVSAGDIVKKGDSLCILEAMKMENEIKSPGHLRVKRVIMQTGVAVDKGAALVELEAVEETTA